MKREKVKPRDKRRYLQFWVDPDLMDDLNRHIRHTPLHPSKQQIMAAALAEYLERRKGTNEALDTIQRNRDRIMEVLDERGGEK